MSPTATNKQGRLLPPVSQMRAIATAVGKAVARQALVDGVAEKCDAATLDRRIAAYVWEPYYRPYRKHG
jgi:malate dehydrogenase (oxaloacetate-decarboxylating)